MLNNTDLAVVNTATRFDGAVQSLAWFVVGIIVGGPSLLGCLPCILGSLVVGFACGALLRAQRVELCGGDVRGEGGTGDSGNR